MVAMSKASLYLGANTRTTEVWKSDQIVLKPALVNSPVSVYSLAGFSDLFESVPTLTNCI